MTPQKVVGSSPPRELRLRPTMLRTVASRCIRLHSRAIHTRNATQLAQSARSRSAIFATATVSAAVIVWCISNHVIHNDAVATSPSQMSTEENGQQNPSINSTGVDENGSIQVVVWGSNK